MTRRTKLILAAGIALAAAAGGVTVAQAMFYQEESAQLRATRKVGEQIDGYLGVVGSADAGLRAQVDAINIKRRASYTDLARKRGVKIEEVAVSTACEILRSRVLAGQYYRLSDGEWREHKGGTIPLPQVCG